MARQTADGETVDPVDWFEDPRDQPESPSFERQLDPLDEEPRIDCRWDEQAEDRIARGLER